MVLPHYQKVLLGQRKARYLTTNLKEKEEAVKKMLSNCYLCERRCQVNRWQGELGFCQVGLEWKIFGAHTHYGEEAIFVPSATLFASGCNLRCSFCQNAPESIRPDLGLVATNQEILNWAKESSQKCKNINLVGGEPTPYLWNIIKFLQQFKTNLPIIWNSNFYMTKATMKILSGLIDVYLSDFKYGNDQCALKLSQVPNYLAVVKRNHLLAAADSEMLIRHLVLPDHTECCSQPILTWIAENLGKKVIVNIMSQYRPLWQASRFPEINRTLTLKEFNSVLDLAKKLDLNFIT